MLLDKDIDMPVQRINKIKENPHYQIATAHLKDQFNRLATALENSPHITLGMEIFEPKEEDEKAALYINATVNGHERRNDLYIIFNSHGDGTDTYPTGAAFIKKRYEMDNDAQGACPVPQTVAIDDLHAYDRTFEAYKVFLNNLE